MDVVLIGLPGSGKSVVGRRLAGPPRGVVHRCRRAHRVGRRSDDPGDLRGGRRSRVPRASSAGPSPTSDRPIPHRTSVGSSPRAGARSSTRNRWALYRGRTTVWLDGQPEVLAQRLRRSPHVRPLVTGRDPIGTIRDLGARRERFYAAATSEASASRRSTASSMPSMSASSAAAAAATAGTPAPRPRAERAVGARRRNRRGRSSPPSSKPCAARRAIIVKRARRVGGRRRSAWSADLPAAAGGWPTSCCPRVRRPSASAVVESAASELASLRVERSDVLVAVGGGALGDTAGFLAAIYLRGIRCIQVPTTLVAQSSASAARPVDLPEGKNLVGAFHQPAAIVIDIAALRTLPGRQMRAALGEAVKMAALGDERLFELLESDGPAIAAGDGVGLRSGRIAELVERGGWAKVEVVRPTNGSAARGGRITLNLGHSLGHAVEAAAGYGGLLHGEAVAYGLRAAARIGVEVGVTPPERAGADRPACSTRWSLATEPLPYPLATVMDHLATDKKHAAGRLRWVLPTADGVVVRDDIEPAVVERAARRPAGHPEREPAMTTVLVLQGPNLNLVGTREPEIYGHESLEEIHAGIAARAAELGLDVDFFQSNHEGALIDRLHQRDFDVAIVNAGGLTHTSVALRDALLAVQRPFIEVHLSDPAKREPFRHVNFLHDIALESIVGQGARGYHLALESIARRRWRRG